MKRRVDDRIDNVRRRQFVASASVLGAASLVGIQGAEAVEPPPDESYEGREGLAMLDRALASLDDDKREVFVLYEVEELSMSEVANLLECPVQTAYSRHRAAREHVVAFFKRADLAKGGGE